MRLTKTRTDQLTEIEQIKIDFPDYDNTPLSAEIDMKGNIIFIETEDSRLIKLLKLKGFVESN